MEEEDNMVDENEVHTIGYELHDPYFDQGAMLAQSYLQMPSGSETYDNVQWSCPRVVMDLKNQDDIHCLKLMMSCAHKNILHAKLVKAEDRYHVAWTEPYTDWLICYLQNMKSNLAYSNGMVPSGPLQRIVSQWFDGIEQLRFYGKYHGNLLLKNTYYHMESGVPVVKLTNFRVKAKPENEKYEDFLIQCQLEDVWAIARGLDEICNIAHRHKRPMDCCLVIDLAKMLREVSKENLVSVMKDIKRHMFFWDEIDRGRFYVCDLPYALKNSSKFRDDVEASSSICNEHWDSDNFSGLLRDMNAYRKLHKLDPYDGTKKVHFCSFCSGLYTHEFELPGVKYRQLRVDRVLQCRKPKACFEMVCLMPDREKKYMLSKREDKK